MISIGLTGGIASGKSQVGRYLAALGAFVVDADRVAHEAYAPGTEGFDQLVRAFGASIIGEDGAIDRRGLGQVVFNDPERLVQLTSIVWPLTRRRVEALQVEQRAQGTRVFVIEAPLLYDAGWQDLFDEIWFVRSPRDAVLSRLQERGLTASDAEARLAAATNNDEAARRANVVIDNAGTLEELETRVQQEWQRLQTSGQ
jgi:dephospho-CoA kinase